MLLCKCLNNNGPKYFKDFFSVKETRYNLRGSGVNVCAPNWRENHVGIQL